MIWEDDKQTKNPPVSGYPRNSPQRQRELDVKTPIAAALGTSAVESASRGYYLNSANEKVDISHLVQTACANKISIAPDAISWAIYSPAVPVFRADDGTSLGRPWLLAFLTCAAPYAPAIGQPQSGDFLQQRIHRILAIARAYGHAHLVLGAWGCGAFGNDTWRTAVDFRQALENDFRGAFASVIFAITDWSAERRFLGPFCEVFC